MGTRVLALAAVSVAIALPLAFARPAMGHARDMVQRHYFAHTSLRARLATTGYASSRTAWAAGEALAWGTGHRATPGEIVQAWLRSPGHRQILLTGKFRDAGVGVARG